MKKCILSALFGDCAMLIILYIIGCPQKAKGVEQEEYEHIDYVSSITSEECCFCGNIADFSGSCYWGEDNVGIVNLNTFELLYLGINR